jgi:restriction endonuclease S subunit
LTVHFKMDPATTPKLTPPARDDRSATKTHDTMSAVTSFYAAVYRTRDILRRVGVCGMDSMRHICIYLLSRYITRDKAELLGVPHIFAWESLIETQRGSGGEEKVMEAFNHPSSDCLLNHFDRLFGTTKFPYDLKPDNKHHRLAHSEILKVLDPVDMQKVDLHIDILGWVYEEHLKTGSSSASRDLGQFFTDRDICNYMVDLCSPTISETGVPETICDPTMGTAGFLTAAIKYLRRTYADRPIDWRAHIKQIHGCDTDDRVAGVARLNLFMETGGSRTENLLTKNSLFDDLPQTGYDVILANMPFGLKGLKYKDCCARIKALHLDGTKSEPLFLQLMMVSLNMGGRCAVVVPDGMLVNSSKCHNGTRKYLLDHFELHRVVKMKGQFFMNTGIQPSILFFEKTGKPTEAVEFWEVVKDDKDDITETMVVSVPRTKIDASCSLDMRRYLEVEKPVANPAGWPMVKLGDVCDLLSGKGNYTQDGDTYPYYDSNGPTGTRKDFLYDGEFVITARKMSIGAVHYVSGKYWASDNTINIRVKPDSTLSSRFLYYWLLLNNKVLKDLSSGIKPGIRKSDVTEIKMPLPPLPIQQEIVATLDRIYAPGTTELADTLKLTSQAMDLVLANPTGATLEPVVEAQRLMRKSAQMVADVKAQMVAVVKAIMSRKYPVSSIGELYETPRITKRFNSKDMDNSGDAKFFNGKWNSPVGTHSEHSYESTSNYFVVIKDGGGDHSSETVGMGKFFNVSGKCAVTSHNLILTPRKSDEALHRYVHYYMSLNIKNLRDKAKYSINLGSISITDILEFPIYLPPIEDLKLHLARLEAIQSQLDALESLQRQSEDNARFILESYLDTHPASAPAPASDAASESDGSTIEHV